MVGGGTRDRSCWVRAEPTSCPNSQRITAGYARLLVCRKAILEPIPRDGTDVGGARRLGWRLDARRRVGRLQRSVERALEADGCGRGRVAHNADREKSGATFSGGPIVPGRGDATYQLIQCLVARFRSNEVGSKRLRRPQWVMTR